MKTVCTASIALAVYLIACIAGAPRADAQQGPSDAEAVVWLRRMAEEVRKLRIEVLELRQEVLEAKTPDLERDLVRVQADRQQLEQEISIHHQEIFSLDQQLAQPGIAAEEQQQLFARRAELSSEISDRLRSRQDSLARQEAAARERIEQQQRRLQAALASRSELSR